MRMRRRAGLIVGLLGAAFLFGVAAANQAQSATLEVIPVRGSCTDSITLRGRGFPADEQVNLIGIFDLIESTMLGVASTDATGAFEVAVLASDLPIDCWQGRRLVFRAVAGSAVDSAVEVSYLIDGPWRITAQPEVTNCSDAVMVYGSGYEKGRTIEVAINLSEPGVEFDFAVLASTVSDGAGEFSVPVDLTGRCSEAAWIQLHAWSFERTGIEILVGRRQP